MCCLQYKQIRVDDDDMMIICNKFDFIMLCALIYMNSVIILPNTIYCSIEHALTALFVIVASYTRRPIIFEQLVESQESFFPVPQKVLTGVTCKEAQRIWQRICMVGDGN